MRTCIDLLLALPHIDAPRMKGEVNYLAGRLEQLRLQRSISNEAYLDAGAVQGAIEMIANMVDMGVPQTEVQGQLRGSAGAEHNDLNQNILGSIGLLNLAVRVEV